MIDRLIEERFRVTERLARQGIVDLFKGIDIEDGEPLWIKRWLPPLDEDVDFVENWRAQLLAVRELADETIPRIVSFGSTDEGELYQIEEPPSGQSLRRYAVTHAPLRVARAVELVIEAARVVGRAHRQGVAHGAISPEALYVEQLADGRHRVQVTHWSTGEAIIALTTANRQLPERLARYLPSEQLSIPAPPATPTSDVFALALTLYELLTGSVPGRDFDDPRRGELAPPRRYNPDIPPAIERVIMRALSPDPALRPPNAELFAAALQQALAEPEPLPIAAEPLVEERVERITLRRRNWLPIFALAVLGTVCLILLLLVDSRRDPPLTAAARATLTAQARVVPDLTGPPYTGFNEAVELAWNDGFVVAIVGFVDEPELPPGVVISQCPSPGAGADAVFTECSRADLPPPSPDTILVTVTELPDPLVLRVVPDLYGQPTDQARRVLAAGGLRVGILRQAYDLMIPTGRIVEQNPRRGLAVPGGTAVDLIVSAGPPPGGADVPLGQLPADPPPVQGAPVESPPPVPTEFPTPYIPPPTPTFEPVPSPTPSPEAELDPSPNPPVVSGPILFQDDFSTDTSDRWFSEQVDEAIVAVIDDGVYEIALLSPPLFWLAQPNRLFDDFTLRATMTLVDEQEDFDSGAGIAFRIEDPDHFYTFELNYEGSFRLRARDGDDWVELIEWTESDAAFSAEFPNVLEVRAEGERLTLVINNEQVAVIDTDPAVSYLAGDIGLVADAVDAPLVVEFDDITVTR